MAELKNPDCTLCPKTFPKVEVLNDHMKLIHQESPSMRVERLEQTIKASLEKLSIILITARVKKVWIELSVVFVL